MKGAIIVCFENAFLKKRKHVYQRVDRISKSTEARARATSIYSEIKESLSPDSQQKLIDLVDARTAMEVESNQFAYECGFRDGIQILIKALMYK